MQVEIPEELVEEFEQYQDRLREILLIGLQQLKAQEALMFYSRGVVSLQRAAELAGLTREETIRQAIAAGIEPGWSKTTLDAELG